MSDNKIIVIGSSNTDMVVKSKKLPLPGETILGGTFFMNAGGKGANQAVAAARLGGSVILVAKVGNDIFGQQSLERFKKENINTDYVFIDNKNPSGTALIMVNEDGENCIVVAPGANSNLMPEDIAVINNLSGAGFILLQLEIPMETITEIVKTAKSNNQSIIINPAPAQKLDDELLEGLFLITPNETEVSMLTGINVNNQLTASLAADFLLAKGVQNVIITMGKKGAYFKNKSQDFFIDAPDVKAIDTTGAGDTFNGAVAVALTEKKNWNEAVKFSVTAASISVTRMGAQSSIPYRNEIEF